MLIAWIVGGALVLAAGVMAVVLLEERRRRAPPDSGPVAPIVVDQRTLPRVDSRPLPMPLPDITAALPPPPPARAASALPALPIELWDQPARFLAYALRLGVRGDVTWRELMEHYDRWVSALGEAREPAAYISQRLERLGCRRVGVLDIDGELQPCGRKRGTVFRLPRMADEAAWALPVTEAQTEPMRRAA